MKRFGAAGAGALPIDVFIVTAREPAQVMAEYARLTGKPELPPLWSFGYLQSHRTLAGPDEIKWVARTMREKKLPCDALIYLGTDFTPSGWNTHSGRFVPVWKLFRATRVNQPLVIPRPRRMWGEEQYFSGCYLGSGEYLIIVSPDLNEEAVATYARRWEIETLFAALKTRGFCLEQTHLTGPERLSRLLALLALTFCWCHQIGEWLHQQSALKLKKPGHRPKSLFRPGFDHLRRLIVNFTGFDLQA